MTPGLRVRKPGLHSTVQDLGRYGYQRSGVPVAGALDRDSLRLANALVGNPPGAPALEILGQGPTLEVEADSARVALAGSSAGLEFLQAEPQRVPAWQSVSVRRGDVLRVGALADAACCYLAVEGGFDVPPCLGSAATYARAGLGGLEGRALRASDLLPLAVEADGERGELRLPREPDLGLSHAVRVILGPQEDAFTAEAVNTLLSEEFSVSKDVDRMGMRLDGPRLEHAGDFNIVSDGITTGAIQVPGSGQPIVLLADRQTTGGYPKIATVASVDVPTLARRPAGSPVRFQAVDLREAEEARRAHEREMDRLAAGLEPVASADGASLERLYRCNLISGVVRGDESPGHRHGGA